MLAEGHRRLTDEVKSLRQERPEIIDSIEEARAHGDSRENAEYHAAKERQGQVEAMISDIEDRLCRAMVIDPTTLSGDKVVFGATVTLIDEEEKPITLPDRRPDRGGRRVGRITYNSPLGRALIGRAGRRGCRSDDPGRRALLRARQDRVHFDQRQAASD